MESAQFPYAAGDKFVITLQKQGGFNALDAAYQTPPTSTEQVLYPDRYIRHHQPLPITLPNLTTTLGAGWHKLDENTFGELGVIAMLTGPRYSVAALRSAIPRAVGWDGDRYAVYSKGNENVALWRTVWDNTKDASRFMAALRIRDEHRFGARYTSRNGKLVLDTPSQTAIIAANGEHVIYVLAPNLNLAEQILKARDHGALVPSKLPKSGGGGMAPGNSINDGLLCGGIVVVISLLGIGGYGLVMYSRSRTRS